jgi:hypothetical protein
MIRRLLVSPSPRSCTLSTCCMPGCLSGCLSITAHPAEATSPAQVLGTSGPINQPRSCWLWPLWPPVKGFEHPPAGVRLYWRLGAIALAARKPAVPPVLAQQGAKADTAVRNTQQMRLVLVAAVALLNKERQVLLASRPKGKDMAGLWEFPGGKVRRGIWPAQLCCSRPKISG